MKAVAWAGAAVVLGLLASPAARSAPVQWKLEDGGNGHWYTAVRKANGISWAAANTAALRRGPETHLATITSAAENAFVFGLIDKARFWRETSGFWSGPWLGGIQVAGSPEPAGGWRWVTGEPFAFSHWGGGEPSNTGGDEHALHFWNPGAIGATWNDNLPNGAPFRGLGGYVVESPVAMNPIPSAAILLAPAVAGLWWGARRRQSGRPGFSDRPTPGVGCNG